jgi:hypothetical protein
MFMNGFASPPAHTDEVAPCIKDTFEMGCTISALAKIAPGASESGRLREAVVGYALDVEHVVDVDAELLPPEPGLAGNEIATTTVSKERFSEMIFIASFISYIVDLTLISPLYTK